MTHHAPETIARWHAYMRADDPALLDALLAEDVVFESPVVHTPQVGKALTTGYLRAAAQVLGNPSFRYLNEWCAERSAILEFACEIDGISINGVDMIFWGEDGRITRFKVMVRPLKAINLLHQMMGAQLTKAR
ncbi:nuclear transport factor 2 family protein [Phenylobacterium sp.]|uniref:nuclear transport factor 2 family protein n=1 Tax=Phenylobacterium sp. TaxID=1871053 RepID=UPI00398317E5